MANLVAAAAGGNWSAAASWIDAATGAAPAAAPAIGTDDCFIGAACTPPTVTNIAAASSGATTVTLTFTGTAPAGMAFKIAGTAGVYTLLRPATSGAAVQITPVLAGAVTGGSAVTPYNCGAITVDNTSCTCGTNLPRTDGNSGGSLIIGGTLTFSTAADTKLVVRGSVTQTQGSVVTSGSDGSPNAYLCEVQVNALASPTSGANAWFIGGTNARVLDGQGTLLRFVGSVARNRNAILTAAVSASATSADIDDITGWAVGDTVEFMPTRTGGAASNNNTDYEKKVITSVTPGSGTAGTIGWSGGITIARLIGGLVGNISGEVQFNGVSASQGVSIVAFIDGGNNDEVVYLKNVAILYGTYSTLNTSFQAAFVCSYGGTTAGSGENYRLLDVAFGNCQKQVLLDAGGRGKKNVVTGACIDTVGSFIAVYNASGASGRVFTDLCVYRAGYASEPQFGSGSVGVRFVNCVFCPGASNLPLLYQFSGSGDTFDDCVFLTCQYYLQFSEFAVARFNRCYFGTNHPTLGGGGGGKTGSALFNAVAAAVPGFYVFTDCVLSETPSVLNQTTNMDDDPNKCRLSFVNLNADPTAQMDIIKTGDIIRDNSQLIRSRSSVRYEPKIANTLHGDSYTVQAASGVPITLVFGLRYDSTYGTTYPPTVTVSGLGITPDVFTAGGSADTDYQHIATVTPTANGNLTITVSGKSSATTGKFWFSGCSISPWIDWTRHYGYSYAPASKAVTVDASIVASEATAIAYTGLAWSSGLAQTVSHTLQEIYDHEAAYGAANHLDQALSGSPTTTLSITGAWTITGCALSGQGTATATGTMTLASGTTCSCDLAKSSGTLAVGDIDNVTGRVDLTGTAVMTCAGPGIAPAGACTAGCTVRVTSAASSSLLDFRAFDFASGSTFENTSGNNITLKLSPGQTVPTLLETSGTITLDNVISITVSAPNLLDGSRIRLYNVTAAAEIDNDVVSGGSGYSRSLSTGVDFDTGDVITLLATYQSAGVAKQVWRGSATTSVSDITFADSQVEWTEPTTIGIDGSTVSECATDFVSVEVEVTDGDDSTTKSRIAAFIVDALTSADGIRNWVSLAGVPCIRFPTTAQAVIDATVAVVTVVNVKAASKLSIVDDFGMSWSDGIQRVDTIIGASVIWSNPAEVYQIETGVSGLTPTEADQLAQITSVASNTGLIPALL